MHSIGILIGGKSEGSNMQAIARACQCGDLPATVSCVISPSSEAPGCLAASALGLKIRVVEPGENYGPRLVEALKGSTLVCLAGFLRLLPADVLAHWPNRVLNIHPALLPRFGGQGMYGQRLHEAVITSGEKESGCTVHRVTEVYDEGEILLQKRCPVLTGDRPEDLAARVLNLEHATYVEAIRKVLNEL